jgi:hypothetical protein
MALLYDRLMAAEAAEKKSKDDLDEAAAIAAASEIKSIVATSAAAASVITDGAVNAGRARTLIRASHDGLSAAQIYQVIAIVAELVPPNPRNGAMPVQWPANVSIDGKILLESSDEKITKAKNT